MLVHQLYRWYLRLPDHPAKGRILHHIEKWIFPEVGIPFATSCDVYMYLHPRNVWEYHMLKGGSYHAGLCKFMQSNIHPQEVIAIAGVSFGQQLIIASRATGAAGLVIGIDPHPAALARARQNITLNGKLDNIHLVASALGEQTAILPICGSLTHHVGEASL